MVPVDSSPLDSQIHRFTDLEPPASFDPFFLASLPRDEPLPIKLDDRVHLLCQASRANAERAISKLTNFETFDEFTPVEAMCIKQSHGTVFYIKVRTGTHAAARGSSTTTGDYAAIKIFETVEGTSCKPFLAESMSPIGFPDLNRMQLATAGRFVDVVASISNVPGTASLGSLWRALDEAGARTELQNSRMPPPRTIFPGFHSAVDATMASVQGGKNTQEEIELSGWLREHVAPVLSEGVLLVLRDQPKDIAGFLAKNIADRHGTAAMILRQRTLEQEFEELSHELISCNEQIKAAGNRLLRRVPAMERFQDEAEHHAAAAKWNEVRRLKRLIRKMKVTPTHNICRCAPSPTNPNLNPS